MRARPTCSYSLRRWRSYGTRSPIASSARRSSTSGAVSFQTETLPARPPGLRDWASLLTVPAHVQSLFRGPRPGRHPAPLPGQARPDGRVPSRRCLRHLPRPVRAGRSPRPDTVRATEIMRGAAYPGARPRRSGCDDSLISRRSANKAVLKSSGACSIVNIGPAVGRPRGRWPWNASSPRSSRPMLPATAD
jgi:hypothetical protein